MAQTQEVASTQDSSGMGFLLGVILLIVALALFFYYGLPAMQSITTQPQINVPRQVDVNINNK